MLPKVLHNIALWLVAIGALNWGLDKLGFNLLGYLGGFATYLVWLIGASGAYALWMLITKKQL